MLLDNDISYMNKKMRNYFSRIQSYLVETFYV
jgi:hypothetical protein